MRGLFLAAILVVGAVLRFMPVGYGLPFVFHPDETPLINELGKFLGGLRQGDVPFPITVFHYPLAMTYAAYFGAGLLTGRFDSVAGVEQAFLLDDPALHLLGRVMSVVFSVASLWLTYALGREVYDRRVGLLAALLLAVCLLDVSSIHWLKADSVVILMSLLAVLALVRANRGGRSSVVSRPWVLGIVLGLAIATRIDLAVLVPILVLGYVLAPEGQGNRVTFAAVFDRRLWITLAVAAAVHLIVSFQLAEFLMRRVVEQPPAFNTRPLGASILQYLRAGDPLASLQHNARFYVSQAFLGTSGITLGILVMLGLLKATVSCRRDAWILVGFVTLTAMPLLLHTVYSTHYLARLMPYLNVFAASAIVWLSDLTPRRFRAWCLAGLLAAAAAQPAYHTVRYVHYLATNVDTRTRAREWIYQNIPFGAPIAVQKFHELPAYLPPLHETRASIEEKIDLLRADGRGSGLAFEARLATYPSDTYAITNLSTERSWAGASQTLENNYDFEGLKGDGIEYVVTSTTNSPLMDEETATHGLLIRPSALNQEAMARYETFKRQLAEQATLVADFTPRNPAIAGQTDAPIDPRIRVYRIR